LHARRWLTALIILPLLLLVLFKGGHVLFVLLLLVVNGLAQWEFLGMFQPDADAFRRLKAIILGSVLLLSFCTAQRVTTLCNPSGPLFVLVGILFVLFLFYLIAYSHIADLSRDLMVNVLALLYIPLLLGHFVWLRYLSDGQWWVFWLLMVIMAGDTGAFYAGRTWGKTKLYPEVSPGKTWAGVAGGTAAAVIVGAALGWPCSWPWWGSWGTCSNPCSSARPRSRTPRRSSRATAACWTDWTACSSPPPWWFTSACSSLASNNKELLGQR
jgi:phosphatidate cytidylyltransferase